jgi:glycosyltransferase involved in cell wall biosynthesis
MPLVSVVLPCFNAAEYLAAAIESVLAQDLGDLELIVVDDASTDGSLAIARSYGDPRVRVERLASNAGYPAAMNHGLERARGAYLARMDADDTCRPARLATQVALLDREPRLALVGTEWYFVTPSGRVHERLKPAAPGAPRWIPESWQSLFDGTRRFNDPSVVARTEAVRAVGGYRTYQRSVQDLDLWFRLVEAGGGAASWLEPLYGRRLNPESLVYSGQRALLDAVPRRLAEERRSGGSDAVMRGEALPGERAPGELRAARRRTAQALLKAADICAVASDRAGERRFLRRARDLAGFSRTGARAVLRLAGRGLSGG